MKTYLTVIAAVTDMLVASDADTARRRPKPLAWFVVAAAVLILGITAWSKASAAAAWVVKVDAHVEAEKGLVEKVEDVRQDMKLIKDGLIRNGLVQPAPAQPKEVQP